MGRAGLRPLAVDAWLTHRNSPFPACVALPNLVVFCQTVYMSVIKENRLKNLTPSRPAFSRSLKVIGTDTDRSSTYEINGDRLTMPNFMLYVKRCELTYVAPKPRSARYTCMPPNKSGHFAKFGQSMAFCEAIGTRYPENLAPGDRAVLKVGDV